MYVCTVCTICMYVCMFSFVMMDWCVTRAFFLFLYVTFFNHNINIFMVLLLIILLSMIKINIQYIGNLTLDQKPFCLCHHLYLLIPFAITHIFYMSSCSFRAKSQKRTLRDGDYILCDLTGTNALSIM